MRKHGHARVDASSPEAFAICDRCGFLWNRRDLRWQFDWVGTGLVNKRLLVCASCEDEPQENLRIKYLPPDPEPVENPRPQYYIDAPEPRAYTLSATRGDMFLHGSPVAFSLAHGKFVLPAAANSFTFFGNFAALVPTIHTVGYSLFGDIGAFAYGPNAASTLRSSRPLSESPKSFSFSGATAAFNTHWQFPASTKAFAFAGTPAVLSAPTHSGAISAFTGLFAFSASGSILRAANLPAATKAFTFSGSPATLNKVYLLSAATKNFAATLSSSPLKTSYQFSVTPNYWMTDDTDGSYILSSDGSRLTTDYLFQIIGSAGVFGSQPSLIGPSGAFTMTGYPATFSSTAGAWPSGAFTFSGGTATVGIAQRPPGSRRSETVDILDTILQPRRFAPPANSKQATSMTGATGTFALSGSPATLQPVYPTFPLRKRDSLDYTKYWEPPLPVETE